MNLQDFIISIRWSAIVYEISFACFSNSIKESVCFIIRYDRNCPPVLLKSATKSIKLKMSYKRSLSVFNARVIDSLLFKLN